MLNKKTKISFSIAALSALIIVGSSFALFSDRTELSTSGKVGTVSVNVSEVDMENASNINPGDNDNVSNLEKTTPHDITFTVSNEGSKSIRTRHTFVYNLSSVGKTLDPSVISILDSNGNELQGKELITDGNNNITAIKYTILSDVLSGVGTGAEIETGSDSTASYTYKLKMSKNAKNEYQGADIKMDVFVDAMQYRNTDNNDWVNIAQDTITGTTGVEVNLAPRK